MIKNTKNNIANTNAIAQTVPCIISLLLKAKMHCSKGKNNKVIYMPYEASNVLGAVAAIKDLTGGVPQLQEK